MGGSVGPVGVVEVVELLAAGERSLRGGVRVVCVSVLVEDERRGSREGDGHAVEGGRELEVHGGCDGSVGRVVGPGSLW